MKNFFKKLKMYIKNKKNEINFKLSAAKVKRSTRSLLRYYAKCLRFCFDATIKIGIPVNEKEYKQLTSILDFYDYINERITLHFVKCKRYTNNFIYNQDEEMKFKQLRDACHDFMRSKEETILKKWLAEIGGNYEPIAYYNDISTHTMEIFTKRPGAIIGKGGSNIELLKKLLTDEFHGEWEIKIIEIRGGFVNTI